MLASLVLPCLSSPYGHLRAKSAWVIGQYCDVQFPDGKCQGPTFTLLCHKVRAAGCRVGGGRPGGGQARGW